MGLFDKISKAVEDVTKAVEDSGVIEAAKEMTESLGESEVLRDTAGETAEGAADEAAYQDVLDQETPPIPDGIADPAGLITPADFSRVTGLGPADAYPYRDEEWIGTTMTFQTKSNRGYFELRVAKAPDGEVFDPDGMWDFLTMEVAPQEPLGEINEGAFRSAPDTIFFRVEDTVMHTVANFVEYEANTADWCVALAKIAADRAAEI